ncbi:MAG: peptide chain release factor N(5)-glutamine methyltransferase [bacterium]|nr:peptide chain release factor N(5)-glutamine methyltransferase [bacterium]
MIPEEYKTGFAKFYGRSFFVNKNVLIPRIETEEIIKIVMDSGLGRNDRIADVGCGSGCIGITLKLEMPNCDVTLIDISNKALEVAKINANRLNADVKIINHDLLDNGKYDLVVANLPYIPHARIKKLDPSVRNYEPHIALDGGKKGLEIIYRLLNNCAAKIIILEIDDTHKKSDFKKFGDAKIIKDQFGRNRFLKITT